MEKWLLGLLGFLIYNSIKLMQAKDPEDAAGKRFNLKIYWRKSWDNAIVTFLIVFAWTWKGSELIGIHNSDAVWNDAMYLLSPVVVQFVIGYFNKKQN